MAILITGGAGYIGSHTCVELLGKGEQIVVLDNFSNSSPEALRRVETITGKTFAVITGDLRDKDVLKRTFADHKIESVIHFAGLKAVGESVQMPLCTCQQAKMLYHNLKRLQSLNLILRRTAHG